MAPHAPLTGVAPTPTVTDCCAVVCPFPVHWKVKVLVAVSALERPLPERVPSYVQGEPGEPVAVQLAAFVELQVRVVRPLKGTEVGETLSEAVGAGFASEQPVAFVPLFIPLQFQVHVVALELLFALLPLSQE